MDTVVGRVKHTLKNFSIKGTMKKIFNREFIYFFIISNAITILQLILMPLFRMVLEGTSLESIAFQVLQIGSNPDGTPYYVFNYEKGPITSSGTGGGLAYFLSVQLTLAIAQIVNFYTQRKYAFKHKGSVVKAGIGYVCIYIAITIAAGIAQGFYKQPVYSTLIQLLGTSGEKYADIATMMVNAVLSFWIYYFALKILFKNKN